MLPEVLLCAPLMHVLCAVKRNTEAGSPLFNVV